VARSQSDCGPSLLRRSSIGRVPKLLAGFENRNGWIWKQETGRQRRSRWVGCIDAPFAIAGERI
jgi:hypothetical protein